MIRYRDKEFEDYFIDPVTAIITDKNGNVKHQYISHDRHVVKIKNICMAIHQIQAHTAWGYKKGFDVHHIDMNHFNNTLNNLTYLTPTEHHKLHRALQTFDDEWRHKISESRKGKIPWNKGLKNCFSEEVKHKISTSLKDRKLHVDIVDKIAAANRGRFWWNNNIIEKKAKTVHGEGWVRGRLKK